MKIEILSREAMLEKLEKGLPPKTAVISFFDPSYVPFPINYEGKCDRFMQIGVYDLDIDTLAYYKLTFETFFKEAPALAAFIKKAAADGCDFLCQCEYGQGRSAGCAAAILEYYEKNGISVFADYRYCPNKLIFNKLLAALCEE